MTPSARDAMDETRRLELGRELFANDSWAEAHAQLTVADQQVPLGVEDLELLATAASLVGRDNESDDLWTTRTPGVPPAGGSGRRRALRLLAGDAVVEHRRDGTQRRTSRPSPWGCSRENQKIVRRKDSFSSLPRCRPWRKAMQRRPKRIFARATEIGGRLDEHDLMTLGRLGRGQALIQLRKDRRGYGASR